MRWDGADSLHVARAVEQANRYRCKYTTLGNVQEHRLCKTIQIQSLTHSSIWLERNESARKLVPVLLYVHRDLYGLLGTESPGCLPRLSHSTGASTMSRGSSLSSVLLYVHRYLYRDLYGLLGTENPECLPRLSHSSWALMGSSSNVPRFNPQAYTGNSVSHDPNSSNVDWGIVFNLFIFSCCLFVCLFYFICLFVVVLCFLRGRRRRKKSFVYLFFELMITMNEYNLV